ncbi:hypothetical protein ACCO45_003312 [Purpureocillium lilacinum]|uniref:Uncharacterized protein n=1 Tax=Purpureocillium lilacinum TaxID=33203 RepID=A0ACC4DZK6_PURLI
MAPLDTLLEALLFLVPLAHLLLAPHTKVEESFNMQAAHDVLVYGVPWTGPSPRARLAAAYDHFAFPGAVPRTFLGAVLLAGLGQPLVALAPGGFAHAQTLVRGLLAAFNAGALLVFARGLREAHGGRVARWWMALLLTQFHVPFYASRTLPNMFAFGLVTLAMAFLLPKKDPRRALVRRRQAVALLVVAAAVFRAEVAILLAAVGAQLLYSGQMTPAGSRPSLPSQAALAGALGLLLQRRPRQLLQLGHLPWHYYFTSALPRLLLNPLALPLVGLALYLPATAPAARRLVQPSLAFIAVYSLQPHKEARFIFYVVPPLTAAAALSADYIATRRRKSLVYALGTAALAVSLYALTADAVDPSRSPSPRPRLRLRTPIYVFDKTEDKPDLKWPSFWKKMDYALMEDPMLPLGNWKVLGVVQGYDGIEVLKPGAKEPLDVEAAAATGPRQSHRVLGLGARVADVRRAVRKYTGGWWIGPRMSPRIHIMKRVKDGQYATS